MSSVRSETEESENLSIVLKSVPRRNIPLADRLVAEGIEDDSLLHVLRRIEIMNLSDAKTKRHTTLDKVLSAKPSIYERIENP